MAADDRSQEPPDLGVEGSVDPCDETLTFIEDPLSKYKINAVRPFDQAASDGGGQPIRVVVCNDGTKYIKQGNHRLYAARLDGLRSVKGLVYSPEQWEASFETSFEPWGKNKPAIGP
jgi:hypothetical protein